MTQKMLFDDEDATGRKKQKGASAPEFVDKNNKITILVDNAVFNT